MSSASSRTLAPPNRLPGDVGWITWVVAVLLLAVPAVAQTQVTFETFGVGNAFRPGGPVAARVVITSDLDEAVPGLVEWEVPNPDGDLQVNRRTIEIPARGGRATTWLLGELRSSNDAVGLATDAWMVRVYEYRDGERIRELATARLAPSVCAARPVEQSRAMAMVIGPNDAGLSGYEVFRGREDRPGLNEYLDVVTNVEPPDLPDLWPGLSPFDLIVWTGQEPRFQPGTLGTRLAVEGAIRSWLERGGHLVIVLPRTGDPWRLGRGDGVLDDLLEGVAPIVDTTYPLRQALPALSDSPGLRDPDRRITLHRFDPETLPAPWRPLAGFRPEPPPFDPTTVAVPDGTPAAIRERIIENARAAESGGEPVIHAIRRDVGQGVIDIVGIDPSDPDIRIQQPNGLPATWVFWNPLLGRRTFTIPAETADRLAADRELARPAGYVDTLGSGRLVTDAIGLRGSTAGGLLVAIALFGGYWLLAGPLGFMLLGRWKMRRHAWLAFASTSVVAAGLAWLAGEASVGAGHDLRHLTVLRHRYVAAGSELPNSLDRATCWFSARLPGYGSAEVAVGSGIRDGSDGRGGDLLRHFSPPPTGYDSGFLDVDRYDADSRRTDRLSVPARATSADFVADWLGRPEASDGTWDRTITVDPQAPVRLEMLEQGVTSVGGSLVNGCGVPLEDVIIIAVTPERPGPRPLDDRGLPGIPNIAQRQTSQIPNIGTMVAMSAAWEPNTAIDLSDPRMGLSGRPSLQKGLDGSERFQVSSELAIGRIDADRGLSALSLFQMLKPPPIVSVGSSMQGTVRFQRLLGRGLDLSRSLTEPGLVVLGWARDVPCPVPIEIDGERQEGRGDVLVQWIHPLPVDVEWLVPPRPRRFEEANADPNASETKGVAAAWR